jgi:membrane protease YdiL (CAAX protease family)
MSPSQAIPEKRRSQSPWAVTAALVLSAFLAIAGAMAVAAAWQAVREAPEGRVALARTARLALTLAFAAAYAFLGRRDRPPFLAACGLTPAVRPVRSYLLGFLAGALPIVVLILILLAIDARRLDVLGNASKIGGLFVKSFLLGVLLALVEETLFRGLMLGDLVRVAGAPAGVVLCSVIFAATHFLGPNEVWKAGAGPTSGPEAALALFGGMGRMLAEWPEFVGLCLAGMVLAVVRLRTGHIYLSMGLHAGWYWVRQNDRYFVDEVPAIVEPAKLWLGSEQYLDGVLGWAGLVASLGLALVLGSRGSGNQEESRP